MVLLLSPKSMETEDKGENKFLFKRFIFSFSLIKYFIFLEEFE